MAKEPVRLHKKQSTEFSPILKYLDALDEWAMRNAHIILPIMIVILLILFVLVCYAIIGVSATESGMEYNQLENII